MEQQLRFFISPHDGGRYCLEIEDAAGLVVPRLSAPRGGFCDPS
jgi:hypothetical protein